MDSFVYTEETVSIDWPTWIFRFENFLQLSNVDITTPQGALTAKRHLLHSGGEKINAIYTGLGNPVMTYEQFKAALDARFILPVNRLHVFAFRNALQEENQSFEDYLTTLQRLSINAAIPAANRESEILHVIAQNTNIEKVRDKALTPNVTLAELKLYIATQTAIDKCHKIIDASKPSHPINAVRNQDPPRECFNCGDSYPHPIGTTCRALGQECRKCHKLNHFARVCFQDPSKRPYRQNNRARDNTNQRYQHNGTPRHDQRQIHQKQESPRNWTTPNHSNNNSANRYDPARGNREPGSRNIRQVDPEVTLFERFKAFIGSNTDSDSSPEEQDRRRTPKAAKYETNSD